MILKSKFRANVCIYKCLPSVILHELVTMPVKACVPLKKWNQTPAAWAKFYGNHDIKFPKRLIKVLHVLFFFSQRFVYEISWHQDSENKFTGVCGWFSFLFKGNGMFSFYRRNR